MNHHTMNLLLRYPQQADKPKRSVRRADAQLIGITHATRALLARASKTNINVCQNAYESYINDEAVQSRSNDVSSESVNNGIDVVIDISIRPLPDAQQHDFNGPVIHLSPTFNGSFACNDITIKGRGQLQQSDVERFIGQSRSQHFKSLPSTQELNADMHYSTFSALPTRVGDSFYRTPEDHALAFLTYPECSRNKQTLKADIQVLSKVLHDVENLKAVTFVCEQLEDVSLVQQVADGLKQATGLQPSIWGLRKGEYHDLFSIMAKSNLVLFGGDSLFADAIICNIPVYPWRNNLPGCENIAQAYRQFSTHHRPNRNILLRTQRKHLNRLIETQLVDTTIPNNRECFERVLGDLINHAACDNNFDVEKSHEQLPLWVIPPAQTSENQGIPDQFSRSVWSDRQKLLQFKQPTNPEIFHDSESNDHQVFTRIK